MKFLLIFFLALPVFLWPQSVGDLEEELKTCATAERPQLLNQIAQACHASKPELTLRYGLEALNLAKWLKDPSQEAQSHHSLGLGYQATREYEQALEHFYQAQGLFRKSGETLEQAKVLRSLGNLFIFFSDYRDAVRYYQQALELARPARDLRLISSILNNRASIYTIWGQYDKALADMNESLKLKEETNTPPEKLALTQNNIGLLFMRLEDKENALLYLGRSLETNRRLNIQLEIARNLTNIGMVLDHFQDPAGARKKYREALAIGRKNNIQPILALVNIYLGSMELRLGRLPDALACFEQGLRIGKEFSIKDMQAISLMKMGDVFHQLGKLEEAKVSIHQGLALAEGFNGRETMRDSCKLLSAVYRDMGDSARSLEFFRRYDELNQDMFSPSVSASIRNIQIKYEKSRMEKIFSRQKSFWLQLLLFSGLLALLLALAVLAVFLNRQRLKRKAVAMLQEKHEEIKSHRFRIEGLQARLKDFLALKNRPKYEKSNLSEEEADRYLKALLAHMEKAKPYLDMELTLGGLAGKLNIPAKSLSQVINEKLGKNFCDFVSQYRLEAAKQLLLTTDEAEWSMIDIAFEAGFNSKTSFNTLFKKHFGVKPSEFRRRRDKTPARTVDN
jgi:AraC-like DNA-binding protein/Tfp pilus assembly protein PilF